MPQSTMRDVFEECQTGMQSHGKLIKTLEKIYNSTSLEEFWTDFIHHLKYALIVFNREPAVERMLEFAAKFATSLNETPAKEEEESETHPFLLRLFQFLLQSHNARDRAVRFRCCQMINKLLSNMGDDAQIEDDLYDKIYETMLQRLRDKFPIVRIQAVAAVARLQDPSDKDCPIIAAYLFLLSCDSNADVRRAVLTCIAMSTKTLPVVLERARDVKETVRKLAFQIIAEKIHIKALTIAQRVQLFQDGLNDRAESVKDACASKLLQGWLGSFGGNILEFLKCLDVEDSTDVCSLTLRTLFKKTSADDLVQNFDLLNDKHVIEAEKLTCESVFYWRCVCDHLKSLGDDAEEQLEKIVPSVPDYCDYIRSHVERLSSESNVDSQLKEEFMMQQLLQIGGVLDKSDEAGRKQLTQLIHTMLTSTDLSHTLVKPLLTLLKTLKEDDSARVQLLVETIAEIREPITTVDQSLSREEQRSIDLRLAGVRVELNQVREELETCVNQQEFGRAAELKDKVKELELSKQSLLDESQPRSEEVRTEKNDAVTLLNCMTIAVEMLSGVNLKELSPTLQSLIDCLILPGIQNEDPAVRNQAVKSLGLCCQISKEKARAHLLLFLQVTQVDQEVVKVTALQVIFDLIQTFSLDTFVAEDKEQSADAESSENPEKEDNPESLDETSVEESVTTTTEQQKNNTASSILTILIGLLDSEQSEIRTVIGEGLAKLMLSGRVSSSKLLSRLLLLWYNPVTEDDSHLRHCLGLFFPIFAFASRVNQEIVEEAFLPTLKTLFNAPSSSPLADVSEGNVAELLVQLTNGRHLMNKQDSQNMQESSVHDSLAVKICNDILQDPNSFSVRTLCKALNTLELSPNNLVNNKDLRVLASEMIQEVKDKQSNKMLEKFSRVIDDMLKAAGEVLEKAVIHDETIATAGEVEHSQATTMDANMTVAEASQDVTGIDDSCISLADESISRIRKKGKSTSSTSKTPAKQVLAKTPATKGGKKKAATSESDQGAATPVEKNLESVFKEPGATEDSPVVLKVRRGRTRGSKNASVLSTIDNEMQ